MMKRNNRGKRGFTLVELSVVLALTSIIVTMCCGFIINYNKYSQPIRANVDAIGEITDVQDLIKTWVKRYDAEDYSFEVGTASISVKTIPDGQTAAVTTAKLEMIQDKLVWTDGTTTVRQLNLNTVNKLQFFIEKEEMLENGEVVKTLNNMIRCRVTYDQTRWNDLWFPLMTRTVRYRYSNGER